MRGAVEACEEGQDTDDVNMLDLIFGELQKIKEAQEQYAQGLQVAQKRLEELAADIYIVRAVQQEHGKMLGLLERRWARRQLTGM